MRNHVEAICRVGPHPADDEKATAAVLDYLRRKLRSYGLEPLEEPLEIRWGYKMTARWKPNGDPGDAAKEILVADNVLSIYPPKGCPELLSELRSTGKIESIAWQGKALEAPRRVSNLIVEIRGRRAPGDVLEFGAHYDSVPGGPGANDNASGVAALLEMARVLSRTPVQRTIRLCFFTMEESGLHGSRAHVQKMEKARELPQGMFSLDSIGCSTDAPGSQQMPEGVPFFLSPPSEGNFVAVIGNWSSGWLGNLFEDAASTYVPSLRFYSLNRIGAWMADSTRSDHACYWDAGVPAIFLTDTGEFRDATYHQRTDTPEHLNYEFLRQVTAAASAAALVWAEAH